MHLIDSDDSLAIEGHYARRCDRIQGHRDGEMFGRGCFCTQSLSFQHEKRRKRCSALRICSTHFSCGTERCCWNQDRCCCTTPTLTLSLHSLTVHLPILHTRLHYVPQVVKAQCCTLDHPVLSFARRQVLKVLSSKASTSTNRHSLFADTN